MVAVMTRKWRGAGGSLIDVRSRPRAAASPVAAPCGRRSYRSRDPEAVENPLEDLATVAQQVAMAVLLRLDAASREGVADLALPAVEPVAVRGEPARLRPV